MKYDVFKNTACMMHMGNMTKDFVPVGKEEQAEIKVCSCVASLPVCVMRFVHASCITSKKLLHHTPNFDSTLTLILPTHIQKVTKPSNCQTICFL